MENNLSSPIDISLEAILELEELKQQVRNDVPALSAFFSLLRAPSPAFETGEMGISMLADVRSYAIFKESLRQAQPEPKPKAADFRNFAGIIEKYLKDLELGVAARKADKIDEAKRFCLAFNTSLLARQMNEIYSRRESSDSRYVSHESTP